MTDWLPSKPGKQLMENCMQIDAKIAKELLEFHPETGKLYWLRRGREWFASDRACNAWNARFAGAEAGSRNGKGYLQLTIAGRVFQAHRLAWLIHTGEDAPADIDHINGNKTDNSARNLRAVGHAENGRNRKRNVTSSTGANGVSWNATFGKFQARITVDGKTKSLGYFEALEDAVSARERADRQHAFHPNHGREG